MREIAAAEGLVQGAADGTGAVVVVEGAPGMGKTRLLDEVSALAEAAGMVVASGRADELDRISPWSSLIDALSTTAPPIVDPDALLAPSERLDQRGAVVETMRTSLEQVARPNPVMVILDDLQWADPASVAALAILPEQLFSYPIVWLLARRPTPSSANLDVLLARLDSLGASHWPLEPLDEEATMALANDVAGRALEMTAAEMLMATGGNPLFVRVAMRNQGAGDISDNEMQDHPGATAGELALEAAVSSYLRSLSEATVEVLRVLSVLGHDFSVEEAAELRARPSAELLPIIEDAMKGGVLVEAGTRLAFCHDVFRQVLYDGIPGPVRRSLHREAAAVLRNRGASPTRLAGQLVIGATSGDEEAAASLLEAIGLLVGTSPWSAADLALRLVDLATPGTEEEATAVSMAVSLLAWAGRGDEALDLGERFLQNATASAAIQADVLLGIRRAWLQRHSRSYPRPLPPGILDDPGVPTPVRAILLAYEHIGGLHSGDLSSADAKVDEAMGQLEGTGTDLDIASVQPLWVSFAQYRGRFLLALERAEQDLHPIGPRTEEAATATKRGSLAGCLGGLGRIREGLQAADEAIQRAESSGYPFSLPQHRAIRATHFLELGRLEHAKAEAAAAAALALDAEFLDFAAVALTALIESTVRMGDLDAANNALERMPRAYDGGSPIPEEHWGSALVAQAHGRDAVALRALQPVFDELAADRFAIAVRHPGRLPQLAGLALRHGNRSAAEVAVEAAGQLAAVNAGIAFLDHVERHCRSLLDNDPQLLREAYEMSQPEETRLVHAILSEDLGVVEADVGRRTAAVAALEEAFGLFDEMGAQRDAARVRGELRKLGVRKRHAAVGERPVSGWASLTPAELSVVRVVGRGLTNRAAAAELFISPDTVNTHLRHAFAKLEIRSRVALAHIVSAHDADRTNDE